MILQHKELFSLSLLLVLIYSSHPLVLGLSSLCVLKQLQKPGTVAVTFITRLGTSSVKSTTGNSLGGKILQQELNPS